MSIRPTRRHPLQKRAARSLFEELSKLYPGHPFSDVGVIEEAEFNDIIVYIFDGRACFFRYEGKLAPLLTMLIDKGYSWLPRVYVDRGAARAMVRGADLMIPGVRGVEGDFDVGSIVVIVDEESRAPVAVGEALLDFKALREAVSRGGKGKALRNIHHVGDKLWSIASSIR